MTIVQLKHTDEADDKVYEYTCTMRRDDGTVYDDVLVACNDEHAFEEAWYEFDGKCIAVKKGKFLYDNK